MATLTVTEQTTVTRKLEYAPCLNCGSTDIRFFDYGYTQGNSGGGKCNCCGNESTSAMHWDVKKDQLVATWNARNDPVLLVAAQRKIIEDAQARIMELITSVGSMGGLVPSATVDWKQLALDLLAAGEDMDTVQRQAAELAGDGDNDREFQLKRTATAIRQHVAQKAVRTAART